MGQYDLPRSEKRSYTEVALEEARAKARKDREEAAYRANYKGPIATQGESHSPLGDKLTQVLEWLGLSSGGAYDFGQKIDKAAEALTPYGPMKQVNEGDFAGAAESLVGGPELAVAMTPAKKIVQGAERVAAPAGRGELAELAAPAVHSGGNQSLVDKIYQHAAENPARYPPAKEPVFDTSGDVTAKTRELVPQQSIREQLPQRPDMSDLPLGGRIKQITDNEEAISHLLAQDLSRVKGKPLPFYATGPVIEGLADKAELGVRGANKFMRDWSGFGAATSPRTKTPPNLRNAGFLMYRDAIGDPLTPARQLADKAAGRWGFDEKGKPLLNQPGFPMMGMHTTLADEFSRGVADPLKNSKPFTFRENWAGNMEDVTADTHNIRKILDAYDRLFPGSLQRDWFKSEEAFQHYKNGGGFPKEGELPIGDIEDSLGTKQIGGRKTQVEYPLIQRPTELAAQQLGIQPAQAQERLWFEGGSRTGLKSPPMTIPDLLNAQIEATAKATGLAPEQILKLWGQRGIPLASNEPDPTMQGTSMVG
jgi:hypothetical protein